ncbi:MAG TPA: hypothetical protein VHE55_14150 [Fimbriimonadaceae bacterium]|nr:hypothetical protein [Fimbriimonadaceae bacterium]
MRNILVFAGVTVLTAFASIVHADILQNYENLSEGFLGTSFTNGNVAYHDVNNVSGIYADGNPFGPSDLGNQLIIEDATDFYQAFPTYGSPVNALTFGSSYVQGPNLSIGALASVFMDIDQTANAASLDIAFYENGPWGGIVYHLDALQNGQVVGSDMFTIADGGGRDDATFTTMSVSAASFNGLHLYATLNGQYTAPRGMIDDLRITTPVPEPASFLALGLPALALILRRKLRS